jgi:hypothetical protein
VGGTILFSTSDEMDENAEDADSILYDVASPHFPCVPSLQLPLVLADRAVWQFDVSPTLRTWFHLQHGKRDAELILSQCY